ncbi:hypothetical protein FDW96_01115 [Citrobacter sp. TBCS-15]|nr:hypothetical protein FDW96_01115 [Citrobacter sp. TBCS-15]
MPRFGFGSLAARPLSYWQYGHSALCASAFQECMADFGLTRLVESLTGGSERRNCFYCVKVGGVGSKKALAINMLKDHDVL